MTADIIKLPPAHKPLYTSREICVINEAYEMVGVNFAGDLDDEDFCNLLKEEGEPA